MMGESNEEAAVTLTDVSQAGLTKALGHTQKRQFSDAAAEVLAATNRSQVAVCGVSAVLARDAEEEEQKDDQQHAQHDKCSSALPSAADVASEWIAEEHVADDDDAEFCWEEDEEDDEIEEVRIQAICRPALHNVHGCIRPLTQLCKHYYPCTNARAGCQCIHHD
jgi:hypothetical protein